MGRSWTAIIPSLFWPSNFESHLSARKVSTLSLPSFLLCILAAGWFATLYADSIQLWLATSWILFAFSFGKFYGVHHLIYNVHSWIMLIRWYIWAVNAWIMVPFIDFLLFPFENYIGKFKKVNQVSKNFWHKLLKEFLTWKFDKDVLSSVFNTKDNSTLYLKGVRAKHKIGFILFMQQRYSTQPR